MRGRRALDPSPNDGPPEERLRAELEDYREMIRRYDEKLDELQAENERLRDKIADLKGRASAGPGPGPGTTSVVLRPDKHTKRTVRFEEQTSRERSAIFGTLYVQKSWLYDQGWKKDDELTVTIELAKEG